MKYRDSPAYVQRIIDQVLRSFREFCRAYVNDIIIFSTSLKNHLRQLRQIFQALDDVNIHLTSTKVFLELPSVQLLNQHVDTLNLTTSEDKLTVIRNLEFSRTLAALERYLRITDYLKQYVPYYLTIVTPLQQRKTLLNRNCKSTTESARKFEADRAYLQTSTSKELNTYYQLQQVFASPIILYYHDRIRQLYVDLDVSKEFGFEAHVYYIKADLQQGSD